MQTDNMNAIIVDDEFRSAEMTEWLIKMYFPTIEILGKYEDSVEALHNINKLMPQILFLDIQMPFMNGFELLSKLRIVPSNVIFLTAYNGKILDDLRTLQIPHMHKPIDHDDFKELVSNSIEGILKPLSSQIIKKLVNLKF